ncbi:hotdog domain-containing protein [Thalassoglobus sp. JC818]|uniref:thioesterase family protein n=1 Tax=Thalassoglobus sp. JC818 TaxID=3232136 RepID=UPI00345ADFAE
MKSIPKVSQTHHFAKTIDESLTIQFDGLPPVLSTPHLIWNLETAAMELLEEYLSEGEISLGVQVDVEHLSAALIGDSVQFRATVVNASEKEILFRVDATLSGTVVSRGLHRRRLVSVATMQKRLQR